MPTSIIIILPPSLSSLFLHPNVFQNAGRSSCIDTNQAAWAAHMPVDQVDQVSKEDSTEKNFISIKLLHGNRLQQHGSAQPHYPVVFHLIISGKIWKKRISSQPVIQNWGFREETSQYLNQ